MHSTKTPTSNKRSIFVQSAILKTETYDIYVLMSYLCKEKQNLILDFLES